jgi:hypothetical protein
MDIRWRDFVVLPRHFKISSLQMSGSGREGSNGERRGVMGREEE